MPSSRRRAAGILDQGQLHVMSGTGEIARSAVSSGLAPG